MTATASAPSAPVAPGRLGEPIGGSEMFGYLEALGRWRDARRIELDGIDAAVSAAPDSAALTSDLLLSMALWKSVSDRYQLLVTTFDSGRVGPVEARRLSSLVWGRLDPDPQHRASSTTDSGSLAVSLPEACRLSDALAASLRTRLLLDGDQTVITDRINDLREAVERIRDQVGLVPAGQRGPAEAEFNRLERRLTDLVERTKRGADVGGLIGPLEGDAARAERDLIVAAGRRLELRRTAEDIEGLRTELEARGAALLVMADRCVREVCPAPRFAIPDVTTLGPTPADPDSLTGYSRRLKMVARALDQAEAAYASALRRRAELAAQLEAYHGKAAAAAAAVAAGSPATSGAADSPGGPQTDLESLYAAARATLDRAPTDLVRLTALAGAYRAYIDGYLEAAEENR